MKTLKHLPEDEEENIESDMTFVGMTGMIDPLRKKVAKSVRICRNVGIRIIMITGDHKVAALAVAKELPIWQNGDTVISGEDLPAVNEEGLDRVVEHTTVFARVSPADKLRTIQFLKRNGEAAAMTDDGVSDSSALKAVDTGVAMGRTGADVAKEASGMILLDDSFTTIAYATKEGRRVYRNIQKVIQFLLAGNIAEITTLFLATLFNWEAPLLAVHILWVNLATATLPALALGVDPASKSIMKHKPVKAGTLLERDLIVRVIRQGIFVAAMTIAVHFIGANQSSHITSQTTAFSVLAISQMFRAFNQRSNAEPTRVRAGGPNPWLAVSFLVSAGLMVYIPFISFLQSAFRLAYLTGIQWLTVMGLFILSIVQMEAVKWVKRARKREKR